MPNTKRIMQVPRSKKFTKAEKTIERELKKELGEEVKTILDNIDKLAKKGKKRQEIEEMMAAQITQYTKENLLAWFVLVT